MVLNMTVLSRDEVSFVTLSSDLSRVARLILLASMASIGSIGNVFMISAVMKEDYLRKRGNAFIVNVALADFMVSGLLIPASAIVIISGHKEHLSVCKFQWFLAALCFLVTVLSLAATACENYSRLCCANSCNLTRTKVTTILIIFWILCSITSGLQFASDLSFDYCNRRSGGLVPYQATVGVIFVFLPLFFALFCYIRTGYSVYMAKSKPAFKPAVTFTWDYALMQTNALSYLLFIIFWLPFGVVLAVGTFKTIPNSIFYNLAWFAISKSCVNSILYCACNRHFRSAYVNLFHYCCCKTTVSFSRASAGRPQRALDSGCVRPSGDVRVHIIPGYNMYCSPQRAGLTSGGGGGGGGGSSGGMGGGMGGGGGGEGKRGGGMSSSRSNGGRDVYEL